ncbi:hypothetical protein OCK74_21885 [Chitinophagaceae bacterium LB-8]|uniref:HEPN AbiU2-like domain-containing protein n=1 Tax=Paraflavisolibacter caeni TaxID=2982496 RepID=A0A9X2XZK0_9BACT|nr:hypothetical protein [Paraflavisolibacter caeni]MCU7551787.1 hypothetical protein [Paraflavisolibacter caeni]
MNSREETIELYKRYTNEYVSIIYDNIAMKLATFKGFDEYMKRDMERTIKSFPLLYFMLESLHVDCVITVSKITEGSRSARTIQNFIAFVKDNLPVLKEEYPDLSESALQRQEQLLTDTNEQITRIKKQRDKYYAHADKEYFLKQNKIKEDFPNTYEDLEDILIALQSIIGFHYNKVNQGSMRVCMSDYAYMYTFKTMEQLVESTKEWIKKYRPDETF